MIAEVRRVTPPDLAVCNVDGGILYDCRINGPLLFRPFENIQGFHKNLQGGLEVNLNYPSDARELI